jgi:hypothetical protein
MATNLRKPSRQTVDRLRDVRSRLGRETTAKIIGVRPSRLDRLYLGRGRTDRKIASKITAAYEQRDVLAQAQARARIEKTFIAEDRRRKTERIENRQMAELLSALQLSKRKNQLSARQNKKIVSIFIKMGVPPSGPAAVYFKRAGRRRR